MIKADEEIKAMQKSADVLCAAMNHIRKTIKIGETETGVASRLIKHMFANGATGLSFPPIVAFGENAANIHHISSDRKLRKNDNILVDAGCVYDKYCSDITRCWYVGEVSNEVKKAYDVVLRANLVGIANAKISMKGKELDTIVRNVVTLGLGCDYEHGTGHGIGLIVHENPYVNKIYDGRLLENSVFTIEPGIYFEKKFGFRVEDRIVLTKKGPKILTSKCSKTFTNHF